MKTQGIKLFLVLIVLCNVVACSKTPLVYEYNCPKPANPELPLLIAEKYLEDPQNIEILMHRDDILRLYIRALQETIMCYELKKE